MLTINIVCVGKIKEKYWTDAISEYTKRISSYAKLNIIELEEEKLPQNPSQSQINSTTIAEGKRIADKLKGGYNIAMCIEGKTISSEDLSKKLEDITINGISTINFVIGGSWGISQEVKQKSDFKLSMSKMTFPHQMARVILCEQLYRAFQISSGGKYHK